MNLVPITPALFVASFLIATPACHGPAGSPAASPAIAPTTPAQSAEVARRSSALSTIYTIRGILQLYKTEHADKYPTYLQMAEWGALNQSTDKNGDPGKDFGPYITNQPCQNPFNGKSATAPAGAATPETGWTYNEANGKLCVVLTADQARIVSLDADFVEIAK